MKSYWVSTSQKRSRFTVGYCPPPMRRQTFRAGTGSASAAAGGHRRRLDANQSSGATRSWPDPDRPVCGLELDKGEADLDVVRRPQLAGVAIVVQLECRHPGIGKRPRENRGAPYQGFRVAVLPS